MIIAIIPLINRLGDDPKIDTTTRYFRSLGDGDEEYVELGERMQFSKDMRRFKIIEEAAGGNIINEYVVVTLDKRLDLTKGSVIDVISYRSWTRKSSRYSYCLFTEGVGSAVYDHASLAYASDAETLTMPQAIIREIEYLKKNIPEYGTLDTDDPMFTTSMVSKGLLIPVRSRLLQQWLGMAQNLIPIWFGNYTSVSPHYYRAVMGNWSDNRTMETPMAERFLKGMDQLSAMHNYIALDPKYFFIQHTVPFIPHAGIIEASKEFKSIPWDANILLTMINEISATDFRIVCGPKWTMCGECLHLNKLILTHGTYDDQSTDGKTPDNKRAQRLADFVKASILKDGVTCCDILRSTNDDVYITLLNDAGEIVKQYYFDLTLLAMATPLLITEYNSL